MVGDENISIFKDVNISLDDIGRIAQQFVPESYRPSQEIIHHEEYTDSFFIISEGAVEVIKDHGTEEERILETLEKGDCFGEESLLSGKPSSVTFIAAGEVELLLLKKQHFEDMLRDFPRLNRYFLDLFLKSMNQI